MTTGILMNYINLGLDALHAFSGEFPELRAVLVLPVAHDVAVHNAVEALPLYWHAQPHAQPTG